MTTKTLRALTFLALAAGCAPARVPAPSAPQPGARAVRSVSSEVAHAAEARTGRPVLVAANGDFFRYTPPGVPVGAQVSDGRIIRGPAKRPVFGIDAAGEPFIAVVTLGARSTAQELPRSLSRS